MATILDPQILDASFETPLGMAQGNLARHMIQDECDMCAKTVFRHNRELLAKVERASHPGKQENSRWEYVVEAFQDTYDDERWP